MRATLIEKLPLGFNEDISDDLSSGVFGGAFLPEKWLESGDFSPFEFYVGRLNISEFRCEQGLECKLLSEKGAFLYFFAEAKNFKFSCLKPRVCPFVGEADAYTEFNDCFFEQEEVAYKLAAVSGGEVGVFEVNENEVTLLSLPSNILPFDIAGERLEFYMARGDFLSGDFSKCKIRTA